jgi:hypothetical protein
MTLDELDTHYDHKVWKPIEPRTEAEKIVAALNALNRALPEPAYTTTLLKVSWLLPSRIRQFQPLSLQVVLCTTLSPIPRGYVWGSTRTRSTCILTRTSSMKEPCRCRLLAMPERKNR